MTAPLVYITGASSGLGLALAERFEQAGYRLALVARRAPEMAAWSQARGHDRTACGVYSADVRDVHSITAVGRECIARQGLPDIVVANAGISIGMDTAELDDLEVMRATYETNVLGMAATFQPFMRAFCERRRGTLVGMASVAGIRGLPGHGAYCSSKAAVLSYCESLRGECRPFGVRVVTLSPGYVDTPLTRENQYPMPFLMRPDAFAEQAFQAIERGACHRIIPWQMGIVGAVLRAVPNAWFDRALAGRPRKHRQRNSAG